MEGKKIAAYVAGAVVCVGAGIAAQYCGHVVERTQTFFKGKKEEEVVASPQAQVQEQPVAAAKPMQNQQKA